MGIDQIKILASHGNWNCDHILDTNNSINEIVRKNRFLQPMASPVVLQLWNRERKNENFTIGRVIYHLAIQGILQRIWFFY